MISIDSDFAKEDSDTVLRHLRYADALAQTSDSGQITVIAKTRRIPDTPAVIDLWQHLMVIPTNSRNNLTFITDAIRKVEQYIRQPIDLVTSQDPFASGAAAYWIARQRRVPYLLQNFSTFFDNPAWLNENPIFNRALIMAGKMIRSRADFYRVSNRREYDSYVRSGGDPARCVIQPASTVTDAFLAPRQPDPAIRARLGIPPDAPVILWVGHPVKVKRVPLLFRVFQRVLADIPAARLLLIGDMARSPVDLAALAQEMNIDSSVIFHAPVPNAELPPYYAAANVYALTSAYEGVPRVLLEAAAMELPIVALDAPGVDPIVFDGVNGYLITENDAHTEKMASKLVELLRDPEPARRMGAAGREIARTQFSADSATAALIALWQRVIGMGRRDGRTPNHLRSNPPLSSRSHNESRT